jgi:hypothetical protein
LEQSTIYYSPGNPCAHKWQDRSFLLEPENFACQYIEEMGEGGDGENEGTNVPQFGKFPRDR